MSHQLKLMVASALLGWTVIGNAADIKVGVAEALTGPAAKYGVAIKNGFTLAADGINAKGGVNGNKIALVVEDEQGKKEEAINVFKKLIFQEKVLLVFGPTLSNSAFAADPIANATKTVVFGTSNTADGITNMGPFTFRNSVMEADVLPVTTRAAVKNSISKKLRCCMAMTMPLRRAATMFSSQHSQIRKSVSPIPKPMRRATLISRHN
jgi:branched-chain amino acid transport system substrate-binding protein